jgi:hypothetical protein
MCIGTCTGKKNNTGDEYKKVSIFHLNQFIRNERVSVRKKWAGDEAFMVGMDHALKLVISIRKQLCWKFW